MSNDFKNIEEIVKKQPLILFDGVCNLCNHSVQFVIKKDSNNQFLFAPLQAEKIVTYLQKFPENFDNIDSILLVTEKKIYTKSSAALKIAKELKGIYPLLYVFYIIPKPVRDIVYDFIAKNRYKWFGKQESCMMPTPGVKEKFL